MYHVTELYNLHHAVGRTGFMNSLHLSLFSLDVVLDIALWGTFAVRTVFVLQRMVLPALTWSPEPYVLPLWICQQKQLLPPNQPSIRSEPWPFDVFQIHWTLHCNGKHLCSRPLRYYETYSFDRMQRQVMREQWGGIYLWRSSMSGCSKYCFTIYYFWILVMLDLIPIHDINTDCDTVLPIFLFSPQLH